MTKLNKIINPHLLIENNHLNFFNIEFNDESLLEFIEKLKNIWCVILVDNIGSSQEFTENQKKILESCFININKYIYYK
jgi:hypothetical protein